MRKLAFTLVVLSLVYSWTDVMGQAGNDYSAIHVSSRAITGWATGCVVIRGPQNIADALSGPATFGENVNALGPADNIVVSLGDGGMAVLSFHEAITNKRGPDFAVFENSFDGKYLELAFVEVSTDSLIWVRFPAKSDTQTNQQIGTFGTINPAEIHNLAGKYPAFLGTPFFLEDIADSAGVDINNINFLRIVDVVGSVNSIYGSLDARGNIINDPWPTPFPQSGFDLDAVAIIDISLLPPEDTTLKNIILFPNPVTAELTIELGTHSAISVRIFDSAGRLCLLWNEKSNTLVLPLSNLKPGLYTAEIVLSDAVLPLRKKFIKL